MFRRNVPLLGLVAVIYAQAVLAEDPGDRTFTALGSASIGQSPAVGAAGNLAISLPLQLPAPRGNLPLPFSATYNGSNVVGAAGMGWDIPVLGVTRQHNLSRRKPVHLFDHDAEPATADRVFVDIGGGPMLMAPTPLMRRNPYAYRMMRYYRANPRTIPYAAPYYWAAFTFNGA